MNDRDEDVEEEELFDEEEYDEDEDEEYDDDEALGTSIKPEQVSLFIKTEGQLESFFEEFSILSKKKPDGPVNAFKVKRLNFAFTNANSFLEGEYRPFPDFELFDSDDLPTASDVVLMLAQYLRSMNTFRSDHSRKEEGLRTYVWNTTGGLRIEAKGPKRFND